MLTYNIQDRGDIPRYAYLYQCIRQDILSGILKKGEKLPSKRTLAEHLKVGVITVANAYAQLLTEGYIESIEKRGYFVLDVSHYGELTPLIKDNNKEPENHPVPEEACEKEKEYFADFKANRIGLKHFPASRWNHYMREALSLQDDSLLKTVPYNGLYILRSAIAQYLARQRGMNVSPSQIIIGAGTEYLYGRLIQLFGRSCTFASEDPGYKKFAAISASYGNDWIYVPIDAKGLQTDLLEEYDASMLPPSAPVLPLRTPDNTVKTSLPCAYLPETGNFDFHSTSGSCIHVQTFLLLQIGILESSYAGQ